MDDVYCVPYRSSEFKKGLDDYRGLVSDKNKNEALEAPTPVRRENVAWALLVTYSLLNALSRDLPKTCWR